uniref:Glycosyltransferase 25 family member 2 n=1 Tax=Columba livia TaxID=8932 RepID=R7VN67_COLLI
MTGQGTDRVTDKNNNNEKENQGRALSTGRLKALSTDVLPGYRDPCSSRPLTRGEVGCLLSHCCTWEEDRRSAVVPSVFNVEFLVRK